MGRGERQRQEVPPPHTPAWPGELSVLGTGAVQLPELSPARPLAHRRAQPGSGAKGPSWHLSRAIICALHLRHRAAHWLEEDLSKVSETARICAVNCLSQLGTYLIVPRTASETTGAGGLGRCLVSGMVACPGDRDPAPIYRHVGHVSG